MLNNNTYIDLFAGAGGLSEGFLKAGFEPLAHIEYDSNACQTLKTRLSYYYLKSKNKLDIYNNYLLGIINRETLYREIPESILDSVIKQKINDENLSDIFNKLDRIINKSNYKNIDIIVGGPPCQAYSLMGRSVNESKKKVDERLHYYKLYAKFLKKYKPKLFVFENVPGLKSIDSGVIFEDVKTVLAKEGYEIDFKILNAADFGVLQNRRRIIIIGWQKELKFSYPVFEKQNHEFIVNDLFKDLPALEPGEAYTAVNYADETNEYLKKFEIRNGVNFITQHIARPHNKNDREIYRRVINLWNKKEERIKYCNLPKKLKTHKNEKGFLDRFKVVAGNKNNAHTVIAHIAKDGHYYIHPDIEQARSISVREAARIQSFPDDYFFEGSRTAAFTQIGNAVPPLMAKDIAEKIKRFL